MNIALIGNPNSGKTTLFNALTGASQHIGNFPGVTVDLKIGKIKGREDLLLADLPGIYSLSPFSQEEILTRDFLIDSKPDLVVDIVDATHLERGLYLTLQLLSLHRPMVLALNMTDELEKAGKAVDVPLLSRRLGIPVFPMSASEEKGIETLIEAIAGKKIPIPDRAISTSHIRSMRALIEKACEIKSLPADFIVEQLLTGEEAWLEKLGLNEAERDRVRKSVESRGDPMLTVVSEKYSRVDRIVMETVQTKKAIRKESFSDRIDRIATNRYLAVPLFLALISLIFVLTFGVVNTYVSNGLSALFSRFASLVETGMRYAEFHEALISLVCDGILNGICSVLTFLPTVVALFFFLSLLEDTGYMARIAFVLDAPFRKIGLNGRSVVPLLIGFGCSVPAVMASRTSENRKRSETDDEADSVRPLQRETSGVYRFGGRFFPLRRSDNPFHLPFVDLVGNPFRHSEPEMVSQGKRAFSSGIAGLSFSDEKEYVAFNEREGRRFSEKGLHRHFPLQSGHLVFASFRFCLELHRR